MLVAALALVLRDALISGLLISAVAELVALYYVARLIIMERDADAGRFAAWTLAMWPYAFFLTAVYTRARIGDFLAYLHGHRALGASAAWPWSGARLTWDQVVGTLAPSSQTYIFFLELLFGLLGLVACIAAFTRRHFPAPSRCTVLRCGSWPRRSPSGGRCPATRWPCSPC